MLDLSQLLHFGSSNTQGTCAADRHALLGNIGKYYRHNCCGILFFFIVMIGRYYRRTVVETTTVDPITLSVFILIV